MINQYDMVVRQNRELQAELALKDKMIDNMAFIISDHTFTDFNHKEIIERHKLFAKKQLNNASI